MLVPAALVPTVPSSTEAYLPENDANLIRTCQACASEVWWTSEIYAFPPDKNATLVRKPDTHVVPASLACSSTRSLSGGLELAWTWPNASHITISFALPGSQWVAFGLGKTMSSAEIVLARNNGSSWVVDQRRSFMHALPPPLPASAVYATGLSVNRTNGTTNVTFTLPLEPPPGGRSVSTSVPTDIIYAALDFVPSKASPPTQHSMQMQGAVDFRCGRPVTFEADIKPLFRFRDQQAMLFMFDLWNYADVRSNADAIYERIVDKTYNDLATGMPPDVTWNPAMVALLKRWIDTNFTRA